jgi:UDP-glucose 4-epimerase
VKPPVSGFGLNSILKKSIIKQLFISKFVLINMSFMKTSLVTGGAGFIGTHVVNNLINLGHRVVVLDDLSGGFKDFVNNQAIFIEGSITNNDLVSNLFEKYNFNYVFHLAAYAAEGLSHFIRRFNYDNNLIGSINLINEAIKHKIERFVFTSSIAVYGALNPPMHEEMNPNPEDPYGVAKFAVEMDLKCAYDMFGLKYTIFRPHNVYGEYQNIGDKYRNVIGIFMNQLMQGKPLSVFGDGKQTRAFSYIDDVAPHIANCINIKDCENEIFNIGSDKHYTILELAESIQNSMGINQPIRHLDARNEVIHAHADHSKAKMVFNIDKFTSLEEGIEKMANWAKGIGARKSNKFENIEITEKLPPFWLEN